MILVALRSQGLPFIRVQLLKPGYGFAKQSGSSCAWLELGVGGILVHIDSSRVVRGLHYTPPIGDADDEHFPSHSELGLIRSIIVKVNSVSFHYFSSWKYEIVHVGTFADAIRVNTCAGCFPLTASRIGESSRIDPDSNFGGRSLSVVFQDEVHRYLITNIIWWGHFLFRNLNNRTDPWTLIKAEEISRIVCRTPILNQLPFKSFSSTLCGGDLSLETFQLLGGSLTRSG